MGPDSGLELGQHERLDQIIGRSGIEPLDSILELPARSQHDHREAGTSLRKFGQYLQPGAAGKHEIEKNERHSLAESALETAVPVKGAAHPEAASTQAPFDEVADPGLVFNHDDFGHELMNGWDHKSVSCESVTVRAEAGRSRGSRISRLVWRSGVP